MNDLLFYLNELYNITMFIEIDGIYVI